MASPTFLELQNEVLSRDYGASGDRTNVKAWINSALREVHGAFRWTWSETTSALASVAGTETIALPSTLLWLGRIRPADAAAPELEWLEPSTIQPHSPLARFNPTATDRGVPRFVTRWGNSLYLDPTPNAVFNWTLYFWRNAVTLSADADEPLIPADDREVLTYGALSRAAERDRNLDQASYWRARFDEKLEYMRQKDQVQIQGVRRVPMPRGYRGRYE